MLLPLAALVSLVALAEPGALTGRVEGLPLRFLGETVVYVRGLPVPPAAPHRVAIDQRGMRFVPHVTVIEQGDTVEFLNHDAVEHNVFTPDNEGFNLGMIKPSTSRQYTFSRAGVYAQLCSVHAEMLAYVFVGENPYQAAVDAQGGFRIDRVPPGTYRVAVWNSHFKAPEQAVAVVEGKATVLTFTLRR